MATSKHRRAGNAHDDEDPTRAFNTPLTDDEVTLGLEELTESQTMAVAPEDNEALLNELLASPLGSPIGDATLPGSKEGAMRGWAVTVTAMHPADKEQSTLAIAQLDAPTVSFQAHAAQQTEKARTDYQRMLSTQPLTVQQNPASSGAGAVAKTSVMPLPQGPSSQAAPRATSGRALGESTAVMAIPKLPPRQIATQMAPQPFSRAPQMNAPISSHAMPQAPHSAPRSAPQVAIPRIVPGAQKMPPVFIEKKKSGGFSGVLVAFVLLALLGGGGFYGYRTHRFTLPTGAFAAQAPGAPATPTQPAVQPSAPTAATTVATADINVATAVAAPANDAPSLAAPVEPGPVAATPPVSVAAVKPTVAMPVAAPNPPSDLRRRRHDPPKADSDPPAAAAPVAATPAAAASVTKADEPKPAAEAKPAKHGKGAKPPDPPPAATDAEEEEMKKATETLTNSL